MNFPLPSGTMEFKTAQLVKPNAKIVRIQLRNITHELDPTPLLRLFMAGLTVHAGKWLSGILNTHMVTQVSSQ